MCSGVEQLVNIIKPYNLPCHLQGQTQKAGGANRSKEPGIHCWGVCVCGGGALCSYNLHENNLNKATKRLTKQSVSLLVLK